MSPLSVSVPLSCGQRYLTERRSGSKIFAGTAFHRVPAPLHPCVNHNGGYESTLKNCLSNLRTRGEHRALHTAVRHCSRQSLDHTVS